MWSKYKLVEHFKLEDECSELYIIKGISRISRGHSQNIVPELMISALFYHTHADVVVGFESQQYRVDEPEGVVTLNVRVWHGVLKRPVDVTVYTVDGTATSHGARDFSNLTNLVLQLDEASLSSPVQVAIADDDVFEIIETFFVCLIMNSSDPGVEVHLPSCAEVEIRDINDGKLQGRVKLLMTGAG